MRKILIGTSLAVLMFVAMGQATQPAKPTIKAIANPDFEKILSAMPTNFWPTKVEDNSHIREIHAWAKANEGQAVTVTATAMNAVLSPEGVQVFVALQYLSPDRPGVRVDIVAYASKPVTFGAAYTVVGTWSKGGFQVTQDQKNKIVTIALDGAVLTPKVNP